MKLRAVSVAVAAVMVLVSFAGIANHVSGSSSDFISQDVGEAGTLYGPGIAVGPSIDGLTSVRYVPTFQRWDGVWRPISVMDRASGEWPYRIEETASDIRITQRGQTFTQAKIPGASYEFMPQGVKETIKLELAPEDSLLSIPFTSTYNAAVQAGSVVLKDTMGIVAWKTGPFHAWDSADPVHTWESAVASIGVSAGYLRLHLDPTMLAAASYPLYVDPTWVSNATLEWPSIAYWYHAVPDFGDHAFKLGWFADDFDDGTKDFVWVTDSGSWSIAGGAAQLDVLTRIRTSMSGHWNESFQANITFTVAGSAKMIFRWVDSLNYHYLDISDSANLVQITKVALGVTTILGSAAQAIATNQAYRVKVVEDGATFTVTWDGSLLLTATDPSPPSTPPYYPSAGFETYGESTKLAVDDVRRWSGDVGYLESDTRSAVPQAVRAVHTGSTYNAVDLYVRSSPNNVSWTYPNYVKTGAKSSASDADAYYVQDADRQPYYRVQIDLRSTDDFSPALSEIAVIEGSSPGASENAQTLGYEPWQTYVGGMVDVVNGNLFLRSTDLTLPGKGWGLAFSRAYNSLDATVGPLGKGWTHAYNVYLTAGTGTVLFGDGDGSVHVFVDLGNGAYASPRGLGGAKLVKNADATYTMWWKDGSRWSFSAAGKLAEMRDRNGNKLTPTYDGNGRLTKLADDSGIFLIFAYDGGGRLVRVGDHNWTSTLRNATIHSGSWSYGQNGFTSNNAYARTKTSSVTHQYAGYGFASPANAWITKVEACVEAYSAGDDDLGVKVSTNSGSSWSTEQVLNLPSADPDSLTCLDFTSHKALWSWTDLSDLNFRVEVRYVKVGSQASFVYLDWIPVRVTTASRYVAYAYDGSGNLASVTDAMGNSTLYAYSGIMERVVDRADKVQRFVKDSSSRVTEVWAGRYNRSSGTIPWEFRMYLIGYGDWTTRTATVTDASGNVTTIQYDALAGRVTSVGGPLAGVGGGCSCCGGGGSESMATDWDGEHNEVFKEDGLGQGTRRRYDSRGNVFSTEKGAVRYGGLVTADWSTWSNRDNGTVFDSLLMSYDSPRSCVSYPWCRIVTTYEYDWKGNLVETTDPLGNVTQAFYDSAGLVTKIEDGRGFNTTYTYDAHGRRNATTDPLNHTARIDYDPVGRPISSSTPLGFTTRSVYDANDWLVSVRDPLNHTTRFEYNARGERTAMVDANGNRTQFVMNLTWGRVERIIEATGDDTELTYDVLGRVAQVRDPNGKLWTFEYDEFGRMTNATDPLGHTTRATYDRAGNAIMRIDRNAKYTNYTYDTLNRLTDIYYEDHTEWYFQYDNDGNVVSEQYLGLTGPPIFSKATVFDFLDRPVRVTSTYDSGAFSEIVQYTYDESGNRRSVVYPDGFSVTYDWDADNVLASIQMSSGQNWNFTNDQDYRRTALLYPNGLQTNYTYDAASRLTGIRTVDTSNWSVMEEYAYTYDAVGNRQTQNQANGTALGYVYNEDSSLNATTYEDGSTSFYEYDQNDNRAFKNETDGLQTTYTYNDDSSLSSEVVRSESGTVLDVAYSYDGNGNLVGKVETVPGREPIRYGYEYDQEDRLARVSIDGSEQASYAYAADGSRIRRTQGGVATYFLQDFRDANGFNDVLGEVNATGGLKGRYVHGPGIDEPLAKFDKSEVPQGQWYYYHSDGRGSVTKVTRQDKSVANRYDYDDFGNFRSKSEAVPNPYGFTGRETDVPGLIYYRARYYDSETGRFLTRDPAGMTAGPNVYAYTRNNPVTRNDPSGRGHVYRAIYASWLVEIGVDWGCYDICVPIAEVVLFLRCGFPAYTICVALGIATYSAGFFVCMGIVMFICDLPTYLLHTSGYLCERYCMMYRLEGYTVDFGPYFGRYVP